MYLLNEVAPEPKALKKTLTPGQLKQAALQSKITALIESRDPSTEPSLGLTYRSEGFLRELKGKQADLSYAYHYYDKDHYGNAADGQFKLDMARAMVLGDRRFVHYDRIALSVLSKIVKDNLTGSPKVYLADQELMSWGHFTEHYLMPFGKGSDVMIPESTDHPEPIEFTFHGSKPVHMTLEITQAGQVAMFQLRKGSVWRKAARRFVDELNGAFHDYRNRADWKRDYLEAAAVPGLNPDQLKAVQTQLDPFYSLKRPLHELARGKLFDGSYMELGIKTRGYAVRCDDCLFPLGAEIVSDYSFEQNADWSSDSISRERIEERAVNRLIGEFHRETGCVHEVGTSSRTGNTVVMDTAQSISPNSRHITRIS